MRLTLDRRQTVMARGCPINPPIGGQELEALFLGLDEEEFVERILVIERGVELSGRVGCGQGQKNGFLSFEGDDNFLRIEGAPALTGNMAGMVFQSHLPDRHGAHMELRLVLIEEIGVRFRRIVRAPPSNRRGSTYREEGARRMCLFVVVKPEHLATERRILEVRLPRRRFFR